MSTDPATETTAASTMTPVPIRIALPHQLRALARVHGEVVVEVAPPATAADAIEALEAAHPALVGTIRDRGSGHRRPMIRIYAAGDDHTDAVDTPLPRAVLAGEEPLRLVGAIAGG